MRLPVNQIAALAAFLAVGCGVAAVGATPDRLASGPAADYPVTVGAPFTIGATTWTPSDQLNYDAVGQAGVQDDLSGVSAAHKTLPVPSYAEATSLASGRTILVRIVERGPMDNDTLLALSRDAAAQLGVEARTPIRVRRVNPPEIERSALRSGGRVPQRMDTPDSLLKVLRRKLSEQSPLLPPPSTPPKTPQGLPSSAAAMETPTPGVMSAGAPVPSRPVVASPPATMPAAAAPRSSVASPATSGKSARGSTIVQVASFSSAERAKSAAAKLGGQVSPAGRLWRVRMGPFASRGEAAAALGKVRAAGYSDARIQRAD